MTSMSESLTDFSKQAETFVNRGLSNPYVMAVVKITLALYASQLAPRLPPSVTNLFDNTFVKIIAVALIAYIGDVDFQLAVMLAIVYVLGANILSGRGILESYANYAHALPADDKFKLIEPQTMVHPGCLNITMNDLLSAFDGDKLKLQTTVVTTIKELLAATKDKLAHERLHMMARAVGLPYNVEFTEENAPLIATMLMYAGFTFGTCTAPN